MPKFSIIIPVCGNEEMTKKCVDLIRQDNDEAQIILVNNDTKPLNVECDLLIENNKNLGFPIAVNQGLRAATGDILVILNNDVYITSCWLDHLAHHLETYDLVGPMTNNASGPQMVARDEFGRDVEDDDYPEERYKNYYHEVKPWHRLVFFCVAFKRAVLEKVGYLDEQFSPGNFEDDDYCLRAIQAGFQPVIARDVFVYHLGSQTHQALKINYQKLLETNKMKFIAKWPYQVYNELVEKATKNAS
jgi:GT2 family glycosyltransferase